METWKPVPGYVGQYEASDLGNIRSLYFSTPRALKPSSDSNGYPKVCLQGPNKTNITWPNVHRVVALAFLGDCPQGHQVNHKNGNKADNRLENLEYCTLSENQLHSWHKVNSPSSSSWAKLTADKVKAIRDRHANGEALKDLATAFGVTWGAIYQVVTRKTWRNV